VAGSIDGTFGLHNQVVYVTSFVARNARRPVSGCCLEALQPRLDRLRLKADEAMNTTTRDFILRNPEIECGRLDVEPSREFFDGKHMQIHRGSLSTPPVPLTWAARVTAGRPVKPIGWLLEQIAVSVFPPSNAPDNFLQ